MDKQRSATISFSEGGQPVEFPILSGSIGPDVVDIRSLLGKTGNSHTTPDFFPPPVAAPRLPISTATPACCCTAAIRSSNSPGTATFWKSATCC
jgi:hypothetical protein